MTELFWSKVLKSEGCWMWNAYKDPAGYGSFGFRGTVQKSHRVAWQLSNGEIPNGMYVCHHCDNPSCVRPDHLFLGTPSENTQDCMRKGRRNTPAGFKQSPEWIAKRTTRLSELRKLRPFNLVGEKSPSAKLTNLQADELRALHRDGWSYRKLAGFFSISRSTAFNVVNELTYAKRLDK